MKSTTQKLTSVVYRGLCHSKRNNFTKQRLVNLWFNLVITEPKSELTLELPSDPKWRNGKGITHGTNLTSAAYRRLNQTTRNNLR